MPEKQPQYSLEDLRKYRKLLEPFASKEELAKHLEDDAFKIFAYAYFAGFWRGIDVADNAPKGSRTRRNKISSVEKPYKTFIKLEPND